MLAATLMIVMTAIWGLLTGYLLAIRGGRY